jgi:hypothetical protein
VGINFLKDAIVICGNLMLYPEFSKYKSFVDPQNPLVNAYQTKAGDTFYVEPGFYMGLQGFEEKRAKDMPLIMKALEAMVALHHQVVFTADYENPFIEKTGYVYKEISDLTDPLQIYVEDKSRGSDYGD